MIVAEPLSDHVVRVVVPDPSALDRRAVSEGTELRDALLTAADDNDVKVIVLAGLAGSDEGVTAPDAADPGAGAVYAGVRGIHQVLTYCKKIVVAEVDGFCAPTASALCLAADFVVATPSSAFASPFAVAEANYPLAVLTMRANRVKAWMLRGEALSAAEAELGGFVNQVVPQEGLNRAVRDLARRVALMPLDGITVSKMNVDAAFDVIGIGREFDAVEASVAGRGARW
ncbi:MAG: echA11 [Pseudonocardiales bacterium]|nr:echA11 [Pseudonocardiales bacterium]